MNAAEHVEALRRLTAAVSASGIEVRGARLQGGNLSAWLPVPDELVAGAMLAGVIRKGWKVEVLPLDPVAELLLGDIDETRRMLCGDPSIPAPAGVINAKGSSLRLVTTDDRRPDEVDPAPAHESRHESDDTAGDHPTVTGPS